MKRTQNHLIAYLDILGIKRFIEDDSHHKYLNLLSDCYRDVLSGMDRVFPRIGIKDARTKIFSDNIVIAIPSDFSNKDDHHPTIALNRIIAAAGLFQRILLSHNLLLRGSITYGPLYIDDVFVWGSALTRAYELESETAIYPRIIADKNILDIQKWILYDATTPMTFTQIYQMKADFDEEFFIDYLHCPEDSQICNMVDKSLRVFYRLIEREKDDRVKKKMIWHRDYLTSCVFRRHNYFKLEDDM